MPKHFAKLIDSEFGQILAIKKEIDGKPGIGIDFDPGIPQMDISELAITYDEAEIEKRDVLFDSLTDEQLISMVSKSIAQITDAFEQAALSV